MGNIVKECLETCRKQWSSWLTSLHATAEERELAQMKIDAIDFALRDIRNGNPAGEAEIAAQYPAGKTAAS